MIYNFDYIYELLVKNSEHDLIDYANDEEDEAEPDTIFCPCCTELIYKGDYPTLEMEDGNLICPICEEIIGEYDLED